MSFQLIYRENVAEDTHRQENDSDAEENKTDLDDPIGGYITQEIRTAFQTLEEFMKPSKETDCYVDCEETYCKK